MPVQKDKQESVLEHHEISMWHLIPNHPKVFKKLRTGLDWTLMIWQHTELLENPVGVNLPDNPPIDPMRIVTWA
jgi:hypothetical protein